MSHQAGFDTVMLVTDWGDRGHLPGNWFEAIAQRNNAWWLFVLVFVLVCFPRVLILYSRRNFIKL
jgi:hypothetical protein